MIIAGTGHRPEDMTDNEGVVRLKVKNYLMARKPEVFISGMAAGLDLWAGDEALKQGIKLWCAKPWAGHAPRIANRELYNKLISGADKVINVINSEFYPGPWCYHKRNEWMVDHCDEVMAFWNGKESGGTYACINYATDRKPVVNLYSATIDLNLPDVLGS